MFVIILILIFFIHSVNGFIVCDDASGPDCNVITTTSFANVASVTFTYNSLGNTKVDGIDYDVVIRWQPETGAQITHSWQIIAESKRVNFNCSSSRMWFNGITVDANSGFTGPKNDIGMCIFNMQTGVLTSSYLSSPGVTVFFLLKLITDPGADIYIDKDYSLPIIPSDNYDPSANDVTMVCLDPNGPNCNPINSLSFANGITTVSTIYPSPTSTIVTDGTEYDYVVQWTPDVGSSITSSWEVYPERRQDPFDCSNTNLWLNGTIVNATTFFRGSDPYCVFNIQDGILNASYIETPERTVFFLFSSTTGVGNTLFIAENYDKAIVSIEDWVDPALLELIVCDDPGGPACNVETTISFAGTTPITMVYDLSLGTTIATDLVEYDYAVKWVANPSTKLTFSFKVYPDRVQDPFDCSLSRIWINGTVFDATTGTDINTGKDYCIFNIQNGMLPQAVIDNPYNKVYFLFGGLLGINDNFYVARDSSIPMISVEDFDPMDLPSYVCDDPSGPECNVISTVSFVDETTPVQLAYNTPGPTRVNGTVYDVVIKWVSDPNNMITHSWEVYPDRRQDPFDCSTSKVWINGTIVGMTLSYRGTQANEPYCVFDIQEGVLTQALIDDPANKVFFLFNTLLGSGNIYYIASNYHIPIQSIESIVFYIFGVTTFTLDSTNQGSTFTYDIYEKTYESPAWGGTNSSCGAWEYAMETLTVGTCSVQVGTQDNINGIFTYNFPKSLYEYCANSKESTGNDYIYTFSTKITRQHEWSCHYFNDADAIRTVTITIAQNQIDTAAGPVAPNVTLALKNYSIAPCPLGDYILPKARARFVVNYTYTGSAFSLTKTPYLDTINDPLNIESTACTSYTNGDPNTCIYTFLSSVCMPLLNFVGGSVTECAFESSYSKTLYDLDIKQIIDQTNSIYATTTFQSLATPLNLDTFSGDECNNTLSQENVVNVTSQFESRMRVRNRPYPNWDVVPERINFYDDMIIQIELLGSGASQTSQLHIQSVIFHVYNPQNNKKINEFAFNKADKLVLQNKQWTRFYDDVHFCTFKYENGTCEDFYKPGTSRITPYVEEYVLPFIDDICQTSYNVTINDHFSFSPYKWFKRLQIPKVNVEVEVVSIITACNNTGTSRRLGEFTTSGTLEFVSGGILFQAETPYNGWYDVPVVVTYSDDLIPTETCDNRYYLLSIILLMVVIYFILFKYMTQKHDYSIV